MSNNQPKRRALGRGLSALLPSTPAGQSTNVASLPRDYFQAPIEEISPSPEQPRRRFAEAELEELAASIRAHGVIQPLIVRTRPEGGYYLIAGERRWRASQRAGLDRVPVVVQKVDSEQAFERALVENLQRSDLNPIEEAEAYSRLVEEFGHTQEKIAERVGKERSSIANALRLLKLPNSVRAMVEEGELAMGHARALLSLRREPEIETVARTVISKGLSVRATEALIRSRVGGDSAKKDKPAPARKSAAVRDLEERLAKSLGAQVTLTEAKATAKNRGGRIEIRYRDLDDLDRLLKRLLKKS